ncbi:hypothetical protein DBR32_10960 [Taibaiella sp. KBW10]|uniref:gliding motility-associated C-terminal domain-containing protein n=1 Tax=Taibaiella sp. KBW10 TaxID=2153357 RepID=UPI000F590EDB|nr:gliding motility-associated C-terminal domain-containing protein [Taibaiella sp. KBW10]RQO30098.1 hypothetical protein DBR32_10960 [Taibaiella sp. KBW10]
MRLLLFLGLLWVSTIGYGQTLTITNADGSAIIGRYCYADTDYQLSGQPAGGTFSGCGIMLKEGRWYFNPVKAAQGVTVFPYQCVLVYTVNGQSISRSMLVQKPVVVSPALQDTATCDGSFTVEAKLLYAGAYNYSWSPANLLERSDTSLASGHIDQTQQFIFTAQDVSSGCWGSDSLRVRLSPKPVLRISPEDTTITARQPVYYKAEGALYYLWTDASWLSDKLIGNPVAYPQESVQYTLIGINEYGCRDTATARVTVIDGMKIPNAFTPNGDGKNDVFRIANVGYQGVEEFRIINRWGQVVFETINGTDGWDGQYKGQPAEMGTYFYSIRLRLLDGSVKVFRGDLVLIR